jgi:hypothetical protein
LSDPKPRKKPQKFDIATESQAEDHKNQSFTEIKLNDSSFLGNQDVQKLMQHQTPKPSPNPPATMVIKMKDDYSDDQNSSKIAILQKIIKIDDLADPYALYGNDTESEEPRPITSCRLPKASFEMAKTRRQSQLHRLPKTQYFIRGKAPTTGFELMQLNKKNMP